MGSSVPAVEVTAFVAAVPAAVVAPEVAAPACAPVLAPVRLLMADESAGDTPLAVVFPLSSPCIAEVTLFRVLVTEFSIDCTAAAKSDDSPPSLVDGAGVC